MPIEQLTYAHLAARLCEQPDLAASGGRRARQRVAAYVAVAKLMQRFPSAFARSGPRKPLKLGIDVDLVAAGFPRSEISGRGRDENCSPPPAQIPACAANAPGSSLG